MDWRPFYFFSKFSVWNSQFVFQVSCLWGTPCMLRWIKSSDFILNDWLLSNGNLLFLYFLILNKHYKDLKDYYCTFTWCTYARSKWTYLTCTSGQLTDRLCSFLRGNEPRLTSFLGSASGLAGVSSRVSNLIFYIQIKTGLHNKYSIPHFLSDLLRTPGSNECKLILPWKAGE